MGQKWESFAIERQILSTSETHSGHSTGSESKAKYDKKIFICLICKCKSFFTSFTSLPSSCCSTVSGTYVLEDHAEIYEDCSVETTTFLTTSFLILSKSS
ncbi:hypothetical protein NPIL_659111 [Nephila pilipes]|uniref:Uncharacterized protein n=1 Tax=Nephila pilipes TaxID=299642 RepID=A0A8X6NY42_NEPPI|nr:hypothetical protein NPIL_659111 [Nephila pilipes]